MLDSARQARLNQLREAEFAGRLTPEEAGELQGLFREVEEAEAAYLRPANERLRQERLRLEADNVRLRELLKRRKRLILRLERFLSATEAEKQSIQEEEARILSSAGGQDGATK